MLLLGLITIDQAKAGYKRSRKGGADWDEDGQEAMSEGDYVADAPAGYSLSLGIGHLHIGISNDPCQFCLIGRTPNLPITRGRLSRFVGQHPSLLR